MEDVPALEPEESPEDAEAIDPRGVIGYPTVTHLPTGYCYGVTRFADVVISTALPERFGDLVASLEEFSVDLDELRAGGGGRTAFVRRFDESLAARTNADGAHVWGKRNITIERRIGFDGTTHPVARTRGHEIDMFGQAAVGEPFPGVAVEMEWNNKDPFYDRDLINFQALHREGAIVAGVIVTRGPSLQRVLSTVLDKYGGASTHWDKLIPRVNLGGGGECPLLMIGIEPERVKDDGQLAAHMAFADQAAHFRAAWRDDGFDSWTDARPTHDELLRLSRIDRL